MGDLHNEITGAVSGNVLQARDVGHVHFHQAPASRAMAGLPADEGFTGRAAELAALAGILAVEPAGSAVATVAGLAGAGKTALVLRAAREALDSFDGGVLFVDLHGYDEARRVDAQGALAILLRALGVPGEQVPPEQADQELLYRSTLSDLAAAGRRVLVIADNAATPGQVLPLRPGTSAHRLVVTSRHTMPIPGARRVELDVLPTDEAIAVVATALSATDPDDTRITADPAAAQQLVHLCGCLPLALRITAELLADQPAQQLAHLVQILDSEQDRLTELAYGDSIAVRLAFDASYRNLPPEQARLFSLLPLNPGPFVDDEAAGALLGVATDLARRELDGLRRAHLVQQAPGHHGYHLHDLLALYADELPVPDAGTAAERLVHHYLANTKAAAAHLDPRLADERTDRFADRSDALAWSDAQRENILGAAVLADAIGLDQVVSDLAEALTGYYDLRLHWAEWAAVSELGAEAARRLGDPVAQAGHLNSLGLAYRTPGANHQAIECFQQASELYEAAGHQRGTAAALLNIGTTDSGQPDVTERVLRIDRAIALYRSVGDAYGEGIALVSMGSAYRDADLLTDALAAYEQAAPLFDAIGDDHGAGKVVANIGIVLVDLERHDVALPQLTRALELHRKAGDRHGELSTLTDLGNCQAALGHDEQAHDCHTAALAVIEVLGDQDAQARALVRLGGAEVSHARYADAEDTLLLAVARCRDTGDRFNEGQMLLQLGIVYWRTGRLTEAAEVQHKVVVVNEEIDNAYGVATALSYLGLIHADLAEWDTAADHYERSITVFRELADEAAVSNLESLVADLNRRRPSD